MLSIKALTCVTVTLNKRILPLSLKLSTVCPFYGEKPSLYCLVLVVILEMLRVSLLELLKNLKTMLGLRQFSAQLVESSKDK